MKCFDLVCECEVFDMIVEYNEGLFEILIV